MQATHKQVKFKDTTVDKEMLPLVKALNDAGIETLYSCQGFEKEKDRPTQNAYIVFKDNEKAHLFVKFVLLLNYKFMMINKDTVTLPLFEVTMDFYDTCYRYTIYSRNRCSFNIFEKTLLEALNMTEDLIKQEIK